MTKYLLLMFLGLHAYGAGSVASDEPGAAAAAAAVKPLTPAEVAAMGKDSGRYRMACAQILKEASEVKIYGTKRSLSAERMRTTDPRDRAHAVAASYFERAGPRGFAAKAFTTERKGAHTDLRLRKALADAERRYAQGRKLFEEKILIIAALEAELAAAKTTEVDLIRLIVDQRQIIQNLTAARDETAAASHA